MTEPYVPVHIQQQYPNLPPHVQQAIAQQAVTAGGLYAAELSRQAAQGNESYPLPYPGVSPAVKLLVGYFMFSVLIIFGLVLIGFLGAFR